MKNEKLQKSILSLGFIFIMFSGCDSTQSAQVNSQTSAPQPIVNKSANIKPNVNVSQTNVAGDEDSFECVRATPESIVKKKIFPKTKFTLRKNEEFPFQPIGFETVEFDNGDNLTIENTGCENFTLIFYFETSRFSGKTDDARFWYRAAARLIEQTRKGLIDDTTLVRNGTKALNSYIKKNKTLKFDEEISFGGTVIREIVTLGEVEKLKNGRYKIELSFGIGPL